MDASIQRLRRLVGAPSPSGFEQPVQAVVRELMEPWVDGLETDFHGNVFATRNPSGRPRIMLAAHCDEVGFMVRYIDRSGFIFFSSIGGVDAHIVPGQRVTIHGQDGPIRGVVGRKPIHVLEQDERKRVVQLSEQWIDIGVTGKREAQRAVRVGDPVTFEGELEELRGEMLASRGLDDKVGVFVIAEVMRWIAKEEPSSSVVAVSTVQEEIGLRGAHTACYRVNPDIGVAVDVDVATDYPGGSRSKEGDIRLGRGVVITRGPNVNPRVERRLLELAEKKDISHQLAGESRGTPTDANTMQLSRSGVATALLSVPVRYLHTPVEVVCWHDIDAAVRLLTAFVLSVEPEMSLIP